MVGKQQNHSSPRFRSKSPILTLSLFSLSLLVIVYTFSPSVSYPNPSHKTETSFVASLEQLLIHKAPMLTSQVRDDTVRGESDDDDLRKLDSMVSESPGYPTGFRVKVYIYEMPKKFTFDLLWLFHNTYKETSNATSNGSPVHRLIEQVLSLI